MCTNGEILPEHLPQRILLHTSGATPHFQTGTLRERVREYERQTIRQLLAVHGDTAEGKKTVAAILGISIASLYRKL